MNILLTALSSLPHQSRRTDTTSPQTNAPSRDALSDHELAAACRTDQPGAREALYRRTSARIYSLLLRMTGSEADACDLLQDTYYRAFTRIDLYDSRAALSTWLYRIAVNEALAGRRRGRRRDVIHDDWSRSPGRPTCADAEDPAEAVNDRLDVGTALANMSESDRVLLLLRYQEGFDYRVIAEITGCAEGTVASRLHRARGRLRCMLLTPDETEGTLPAAHPT